MLSLLIEAAGATLILAIVLVVFLAVRRNVLQRSRGTFDCSLRLGRTKLDGAAGRGWVLGIARYSGNVVEWYRVFSFSMRPRKVFSRDDLLVLSRRPPLPTEALGLYDGHVVVEVSERGRNVELAMSEDALTGFLAWLEAAPPGRARLPMS